MLGNHGRWRVGDRATHGAYRITREEIFEFASYYDPQPYHLDDAAAAANPLFERASASGMHSGAITTRLLTDWYLQTGGEPWFDLALDDLRWVRPVYPDDLLRVQTEVLAVEAMAGRPGAAAVRLRVALVNQDDAPVLTQFRTIAVPASSAPEAIDAAIP